MRKWRLGLWAILAACLAVVGCEGEPPKLAFTWEELPPLPEPLGVGGPFVGVRGGGLIVAGGANFPTPLFEGGKKAWADSLYLLLPNARKWWKIHPLPCPLAYGASVSWQDRLICIGGSDAGKCYAEAFEVFPPDGDAIHTGRPMPKALHFPTLAKPCAMMSATRIGDTIYVAGGQETPTATEALKNLWALDLSKPYAKWRELEPWPGPGRILPVVVAQSKGDETQVYVISGAELSAGPDGKPVRRYLTDGYAYSPRARTWRRIADVPRPVVAAPAVAWGKAQILVFGGDDGANATRIQELKEKHPGFSRDVLAYDTAKDKWAKVGEMPAGQVTTTAVLWLGGIAIPSGEIRPGTRTPRVLFARPTTERPKP